MRKEQNRLVGILALLILGVAVCLIGLGLFRLLSHRPLPTATLSLPIDSQPPNTPSAFIHTSISTVSAEKKITPQIEAGILPHTKPSVSYKLWVRLQDPQLRWMSVSDLYTLRLWLFDNNWRLLNRVPIPIRGAFDENKQFRPHTAEASLGSSQLEAIFEVEAIVWNATHTLLLAGGGARGTPQDFDFECLIQKSQVQNLARIPVLPKSQMRPRRIAQNNRCRWRYYVIHHPPFQSLRFGWQKGAWVYDQLPASPTLQQIYRSGWSQLLVWHETGNLQEAEHEIDFNPFPSFFEWFYETTDRKARFQIAYQCTIEVMGSKGFYQLFESSGGLSHRITDPVILSLNPDYYLRSPNQHSRAISMNMLSPIDLGIPMGWESRLFGDSFSASQSGGEFLFSPAQRSNQLSLSSSFCVVRVQTHLWVRAGMRPPSRKELVSRVGGFSEPFCDLFLKGNHPSERCHVVVSL